MSKKPLEGIRIVEFSAAWAGPYGMSLLGFLGAEIIKVESMRWPELSRFIEFNSTRPRTPENIEKSSVYNCLNGNKKCVALNISHPKGVEIARNIVKECDVMLENMRPGVIKKIGLGYETIKEIKPDIIFLSSCACGQYGPWSTFAGYAPNFAALSGLSDITGYPDEGPSELMGSVDLKSAYAAAVAVMMALVYRQRTGKGQFIDLSSTEAISSVCGELFLEVEMTGRTPGRKGNRDDQFAPHECYPCRGEDKWVSIAVVNEQEWAALCKEMGNEDLTGDDRFSSAARRIENHEELDAIISQWTINFTENEIMTKLQRVGVAAMPSMSGKDLFADPHLRERAVFQNLQHPVLGDDWVTAPPWRLSETPAKIDRHAPLFGEHNAEILIDLLKMDPKEIEALKEDKVFF